MIKFKVLAASAPSTRDSAGGIGACLERNAHPLPQHDQELRSALAASQC